MRTFLTLLAASTLAATACTSLGSTSSQVPTAHPATLTVEPTLTSTDEPIPTLEPTPADEPAPTETPTAEPTPTEAPTPTPTDEQDLPRRIPDITIRTSEKVLKLEPWTWCWSNGCRDGFPPRDLASVGSVEQVEIEFPVSDWEFVATFTETGVDCARLHPADAVKIGETTWLLEPAGPLGSYDVEVGGDGPGGDAFVSFHWDTPRGGPTAEPRAMLAVIAGHDQVTSYGVTLSVIWLARTPDRAAARLTVTAENGEQLTFDLDKLTRGCPAEGRLHWNGPDKEGLAAVELGPPPFEYEVVLTLDGEVFVGTGSYPDDLILDFEPFVELEFTPPLPGFQQRV